MRQSFSWAQSETLHPSVRPWSAEELDPLDPLPITIFGARKSGDVDSSGVWLSRIQRLENHPSRHLLFGEIPSLLFRSIMELEAARRRRRLSEQ